MLEMRKRRQRVATIVMFGAACLVCLTLYVDVFLLHPADIFVTRCCSFAGNLWTSTFVEGLLFVFAGLYFLAGRGGINIYTVSTAIHFYIRKALYGTDVPDVSEVYRHDLWQPKASVQAGLAFILAGGVLILIYSASLLYVF